jgi:hypothetical protein
MPHTVDMDPEPMPEEAAAIMAALGVLREEPEDLPSLKRCRWRLAGLLGHALEPGVEFDGSLWSYSRWGA